jgi:arylsulfatase A-like enzyme/Flp pilus assembly protein TadD
MKERASTTARQIGALALGGLAMFSCQGPGSREKETASPVRPSILLVTLDTTRADAIGPDARGTKTPAFDALAARGRLFRQAYATAPETLPSHCSLMTGLYPAGHGVHENARYLSETHPVAAERLKEGGYRTAAFVSTFVLARRFGLGRGFDLYDDEMPEGSPERTAVQTTDRALAYLARNEAGPLFLWVHYYDPHHPYAPPEPYRSRHAKDPYRGEVAAMDEQLGRLVEAFERRAAGPAAIAVVGDHGEGLGEHGEAQHGKLLYQATMHVPLVLVGPGIPQGVSDTPVGIRRIFHTILDWSGRDAASSLRGASPEIVLGEAMKPFLSYGWQPQVMAVEGRTKAMNAGRTESYDVVADPEESRDLGAGALSRSVRNALADYPVPSLDASRPSAALGPEEERKLAALGYVGAGAAPAVRKDAPRPVDMKEIFDDLDTASTLFVREEYAKVVPLLKKILGRDPQNLDAALRLGTALGALGQDEQAVEMFRRAGDIAPGSRDVRTYLALHYTRGRDWERAGPLLETIVAETPDRLPAVEGLAIVRERQGRIDEAIGLRERVYAARDASPAELVHLGRLAMSAGRTPLALESFEKARRLKPEAFRNDLELGVLYLAARRFAEAREALDRIPPSDPEYPMALFKRAQVSVLLQEPDRLERIAAARRGADASTRKLIATERLFQGAAAP